MVGHREPLAKIDALLLEAAAACDRVLAEPPSEVQVTALTDAGMEIQVEVSCKAADREDVVFDVLREIRTRFEQRRVAPACREMRILPTE